MSTFRMIKLNETDRMIGFKIYSQKHPHTLRRNIIFRQSMFTLIEVMFAIVIAGAGVLALIPLMYVIVAPGQNAMVETKISLLASKFSNQMSQEIQSDWATNC